jgi:hypothetical protein
MTVPLHRFSLGTELWVAEHRSPNRGLTRVRAAKSVTAITGLPDTSVFASFGLPHTLPEYRPV